jgi:hypothetical protein
MLTQSRDDRKSAPPQKPKSTTELSPPAGVMLALLARRSRSWSELERAGFHMVNLPAATRELTARGHEILIGPVRLVLGDQIMPDADAA